MPAFAAVERPPDEEDVLVDVVDGAPVAVPVEDVVTVALGSCDEIRRISMELWTLETYVDTRICRIVNGRILDRLERPALPRLRLRDIAVQNGQPIVPS